MPICNESRTSDLTGSVIPEGSFEEGLQDFIHERLANYELLDSYRKQYKKLDKLFDISNNDEVVHTLVELQSAVAHSNYLKGFAEGMKFAAMAEKI